MSPRARQPNPANTRRDLLTPSAPGRNMTSPDQEQGKQTAQQQSMRILPIGTPPVATAPAAGGGAPAAPAGPPAAPSGPPRPGPGDFAAPTMDPQSEMQGQQLAAQWEANRATGEQGTLQQVLSHLAAQPQASSIIRSLAGR